MSNLIVKSYETSVFHNPISFNMRLIGIFILLCCGGFQLYAQESCVKITCLNPRDTIFKGERVETFFQVECLKDSLVIKGIRSSHGAEVPDWRKGYLIYPNHPDTVRITSSISEYSAGPWKKSHYISTTKCDAIFYTTWYIPK